MKVKTDREESSPYAGKKSTNFYNPDTWLLKIHLYQNAQIARYIVFLLKNIAKLQKIK
jgi:hypothetical protein